MIDFRYILIIFALQSEANHNKERFSVVKTFKVARFTRVAFFL